MALDAKEMAWAKMAARVQKSREELIGVIGLVNLINTSANREASLPLAVEAILSKMTNFFLLEYCCLFAQIEDEFKIVASRGGSPPSWLENEIEKLALSPTAAAQTMSLPHGRRMVLSLPLAGGDRRLGSLVLIPVREPEEKDRRHYRLAADALASAMENFLLREKLAGLGKLLETSFRNHQSGIMELKQQNSRNQAFLENLMRQAPVPVFLLDGAGRLLRFNKALEHLLGWEGDKLTGRGLESFFPQPEDRRAVSRTLKGESAPGDKMAVLKVQDGRRLNICLSLICLDSGKGEPDFLGSIRPASQGAAKESTAQILAEAESLYQCSLEAAGENMETMASIRTGLQVLLLRDLDPELKRRLAMLEELTHDAGQVMASLRKAMDNFRSLSHRRKAEKDLWPT